MSSYPGKGIPTNMGLDHVGIVVPNAQDAANFLIEVFDAEFDWEVKREAYPRAAERGWSKIFGVHPDAYLPHVIMLKCGEHPLSQYVEIFEWSSPDHQPLPPEKSWHNFSDIGNSYISFTVQDITLVLSHIKQHVLPKWKNTRIIQDPPMQFPLRGEICTSSFLVSPWGMWIEITCWSKSKKLGTVIKSQREVIKNKYIGQPIHNLPTPSFLVDLDIVDHNISLMKSRIVDAGIHWRVPSKAHKCPQLAHYILRQGKANGVVLLTLLEAEQFAQAGINNIYLANQVSEEDIERLSLLAKRVTRLRVAIDDANYLQKLAAAIEKWEMITPIEVLIELNVHHNRCGVNHIEEAVQLARLAKQIEMTSGAIIFAGITGYEGHTPVLPPNEKKQATHSSHGILEKTKNTIEAIGIKVNVVSGGGSCNYTDCLHENVLTEIQAGGGTLCDLLYYHKADLKTHGHKMGALLLTQIISASSDQERAIGNAGFKAAGWHPFGGFPEPRDRNDLRVVGLSAEHIKFESLTGSAINLTRGDKVMLVPGYTDAMGFLHKEIYAIRNDHVEAVWKTVA